MHRGARAGGNSRPPPSRFASSEEPNLRIWVLHPPDLTNYADFVSTSRASGFQVEEEPLIEQSDRREHGNDRPVAPGLLGSDLMLTQGMSQGWTRPTSVWPDHGESAGGSASTLGALTKSAGVTGVFTLGSRRCANKLKGLSSQLGTESRKRGDGVRSISRVGPVLVVFAALGVLVGG